VCLGPPTVVRLEGALTHEVLRYCTAIWGSVLKVMRGTGWDESAGAPGRYLPAAFETLIGHNRKPVGREILGERHGYAKTALSTCMPQSTGVSTARSNSCGLPRRWATESAQNGLW